MPDTADTPARPPIAYFPEIRTLGDAPRLHGRTRGDKPAFLFEGRTTTYAQFDRQTSQVANGLLAEGVQELEDAPWVLLAPATFLALLLIAFTLLGDALRARLMVRAA